MSTDKPTPIGRVETELVQVIENLLRKKTCLFCVETRNLRTVVYLFPRDPLFYWEKIQSRPSWGKLSNSFNLHVRKLIILISFVLLSYFSQPLVGIQRETHLFQQQQAWTSCKNRKKGRWKRYLILIRPFVLCLLRNMLHGYLFYYYL